MTKKIAVLGAGSWGTALAMLIAHNEIEVSLWGHEAAVMQAMRKDRENHYFLPDIPFPKSLNAVVDLEETLDQAEQLLIVVPSHAFAQVIQQLAPLVSNIPTIAWATKGFDPKSGNLLHYVANETFPDKTTAIISGPTFALEVAKGMPTALTVTSADKKTRKNWQAILHGGTTRVYTNQDIVGAQVGGAVKNIMAIAAGISDGLGFGANARAALITRGLAEITRLGIRLGAKQETFMGLTGIGDLALTCTDDLSRNRRMGLALAKGQNIQQAKKAIGQEVEGINTAKEVYFKARSVGVDMPITEQIYKVLYENLDTKVAVEHLFSRTPKQE